MDAEQEALITTETVPAKTWKMDDANKDQLFRDLRNWGAEIRKGDSASCSASIGTSDEKNLIMFLVRSIPALIATSPAAIVLSLSFF